MATKTITLPPVLAALPDENLGELLVAVDDFLATHDLEDTTPSEAAMERYFAAVDRAVAARRAAAAEGD